jgi:type VI protein secretion system component Hcp
MPNRRTSGVMEFDGIQGTCSDPNHLNWINIDSFSMSMDLNLTHGYQFRRRSGMRSRTTFSNIHVSRRADDSSAGIMIALHSQKISPMCIIKLLEDGSKANNCLTYKLTNAMISDHELQIDELGIPREKFSIIFTEFEFTYTPFPTEINKTSPITFGVRMFDDETGF